MTGEEQECVWVDIMMLWALVSTCSKERMILKRNHREFEEKRDETAH
jgi:hypothetical protein